MNREKHSLALYTEGHLWGVLLKNAKTDSLCYKLGVIDKELKN